MNLLQLSMSARQAADENKHARSVLQINRVIVAIFCFQLTILFVSSYLPWLCIDIAHVVPTIESPDGAN